MVRGETKVRGASRRMCRSPWASRLAISHQERARRIAVPHPRGGTIDMSAPLPPHMEESWNLLGFDATRYDPIVDAPEEE